jgi:hypothetical protein
MQSTTAWMTFSRVRALRSAWVRRRERPVAAFFRLWSLRIHCDLDRKKPNGQNVS